MTTPPDGFILPDFGAGPAAAQAPAAVGESEPDGSTGHRRLALICSRGNLDMMKIIAADLHPAVEGILGAADFLEISQGAQTIFI